MTKDEITSMPAGIEMDTLIATKVMGISVIAFNTALCPYCGSEMRYCGIRSWCSACNEWRYSAYKDYSDDMSAAWEVVEKIGEKKYRQFYLCTNFSSEFGNQFYAEIFENNGDGESMEFIVCSATADTASLAICRAALLCKDNL